MSFFSFILVLGLGAFLFADLIAVLFWYGLRHPRSRIFFPAIVRGNRRRRTIALTFDDGPHPRFTPLVLEFLRTEGIKATFFVCGENVERWPTVVRQIAEQGHGIGNHTFSHNRLAQMTGEQMAQEVDEANRAIESAAGVKPRYFRPPYGIRWFGLTNVLQERQMQMVMWSADGADWNSAAGTISARVLSKSRPGSIVLLHEGVPPSTTPENISAAEHQCGEMLNALPEIITRLRQKGFEFESLDEIVSARL